MSTAIGLNDLSREVLGAAFDVSNALGCGFLEKVYENALTVGLADRGIPTTQQAPIAISYRGQLVGQYFADLVVDGRLIVEVKAVREFDSAHEAQCLNYLKASGISLCLLLNFARPRLAYRRIVLGLSEPHMNADERR